MDRRTVFGHPCPRRDPFGLGGCRQRQDGRTGERVVSQLLDKEHPVDADRLLVVTFSNAAAKEIKKEAEKLNQ